MNPLKTIRDAVSSFLAKKSWEPTSELDLQNVVGWRTIGGGTYERFKHNDLENGYPSIRVISEVFAAVEPYTIDASGKKVASNVLDRVYTPNQQMSAYDFREALAVMTLVHRKVRIRVHYKNKRLTADSITGFTFLEDVFETIVDGKYQYRLANGETLDDTTVMTLKGINPYNLSDGYSPADASRRWTTLDDFIADHEAGFFQNGAVPAGQLVITAKTVTDFNDIVDKLQQRHRGAGKNNNITYTHRPTDQNGSPLNSQIEWVPFSAANRDLALDKLFENVNKKIDSVYGVPASLRGVNDENTYASVRSDEVTFMKYRMQPFTLKVWNKFNHELNRITGGTGVALSFEMEMPQIADEEKVKAEAKQIQAATITSLTDAGYTLESAAAYVESGDVSDLVVAPVEEPEIPVLTQEEAKDTPEQPIDAFMKSVNEKLDDLMKTKELVDTPKFKIKELSDATRNEYENDLMDVVRGRMEIQVDNAISNFEDISKAISEEEPVEEAEDELLSKEMLAVLVSLIATQGAIEHELNKDLVLEAGINIDNIEPFRMTSAQRKAYEAYVLKVATGYNDETATKIRNIIAIGREQELPANDIKQNLRTILDEEYRIKRIAVSEVNRGGNEASLMSMKNIAKETGARIEKEWIHDGGGDAPCEFCRAMIGTRVPLADDFIGLDEVVKGEDGGEYVNNFVPAQVAELHPNGHCRQIYRVVKSYTSSAQKAKEKELEKKLKSTEKENKTLSKQLEETQEYSRSLESILDGQG